MCPRKHLLEMNWASPQSGTKGTEKEALVLCRRDLSSRLVALVRQSDTKLLARRRQRPASLDARRRGKVSILVLTAGGPSSASKRRSFANRVQRIGSLCTAQFIFNAIGDVPPANWADFRVFLMQICYKYIQKDKCFFFCKRQM